MPLSNNSPLNDLVRALDGSDPEERELAAHYLGVRGVEGDERVIPLFS